MAEKPSGNSGKSFVSYIGIIMNVGSQEVLVSSY